MGYRHGVIANADEGRTRPNGSARGVTRAEELEAKKRRITAQVEELTHAGRLQLAAPRQQLVDAGIDDVCVRVVEGDIAVTMQQSTAGASSWASGARTPTWHASLSARMSSGSFVPPMSRYSSSPAASDRLIACSCRWRMSRARRDRAAGRRSAKRCCGAAACRHSHRGTGPPAGRDGFAARAAGYASNAATIEGEPRLAIPARVVLERFDLLAMGGFAVPGLSP